MAGVSKAARLDHPYLAALSEVGVQDHWPFVAVERSYGVTLGEWLAAHPTSGPAEMVDLMIPALQGLAFAHDAGVAHLDVQPHTLLINEQGRVRWMALGVARQLTRAPIPGPDRPGAPNGSPTPLSQIHEQRKEAEGDLLRCGLLMHRWLAGRQASGA